jgi:pantoate--beta-alanine ligase
MRVVHTVAELRTQVAAWRRAGERVGFVPTMGNLHRGHYALVTQARSVSARVVASVFVNPTQFGPNEDFARYPRTLDADAAGLRTHGCDLLFAPSVEEMYPGGAINHVIVNVPGLDNILCGAFRPGHFAGVATVVAKLLNQVQADVAVFGQKDYQQVLVIQRLVRDLAIPVRIVVGDTVREDDGLAMSSRNQYLNSAERERASAIFRTLNTMAADVRAGMSHRDNERVAHRTLTDAGFVVDYAAIRSADALSDPSDQQRTGLVALIAARLGVTRLIDNVLI